MSGGPMPIFLEVHRDNQPVWTAHFQQDVVKIGKHPLNHLHLGHHTVSHTHAYIEVSDERATIVDLGSGVGTYVNGSKVYKHALSPGDSIHIGDVRLVYVLRDESPNQKGEETMNETAVPEELKHVDAWLDSPVSPESRAEAAARLVCEVSRMPAWKSMIYQCFMPSVTCEYEGSRYRLIGASRFGEVYLTHVSAQSMGYTHRVAITSCTNWEVTPCP